MKTQKEIEDFYIEYEKAHRKFKPIFKKYKKKIIKAAKEFQCFDYAYMENVLFEMLKLIYEYYKVPELLMQDIYAQQNGYEESLNALKRINEIIDILRQEYIDIDQCIKAMSKEGELKTELYSLIAKYSTFWWD